MSIEYFNISLVLNRTVGPHKKKLKILTVTVVWQTYLWLGYNVRCQYFKLVGFIIQAIFVKKFCNRVLLGIMVEL